MVELQSTTRKFVAILAVATVAAASLLLGIDNFAAGADLRIAFAVAAAMTIAWLLPIPFGFQIKLYLDTVVIFAAALIFHPGQAMVIVACGTCAAQVLRRRTLPEVAFNSSQTAVQAGAAGLILLMGGWSYQHSDLGPGSTLSAIALAAVSIYLINALLVGTMIACETSGTFRSIFALSNFVSSSGEIASQSSQLVIGLLAVELMTVSSWWLIGLIPPLIALYAMTSRHLTPDAGDSPPQPGSSPQRSELWWHSAVSWFWSSPRRFTTRAHYSSRLRSIGHE